MTRSRDILGTPSYMAPEQAAGRISTVGPAADVYGLGAILYEVLTGRPPFRAEGLLETLEQVRYSEPVPPRHLRPRLAHDLETICLKCLQKEPAARYAGAGALAEDLRRYLAGASIQARPVPAWQRAARWVRRRPALTALLAALAALVLVSVAAALVYQDQQRQHDTDLKNAVRREEEDQHSQRQSRYAVQMRLAWQAYEQGQFQTTADLLAAQRPATGEADFRGFEWRYLQRSLPVEPSQPQTVSAEAAVCAAALSPDGTVLAVGTNAAVQLWDAHTRQLRGVLPYGHVMHTVVFSRDGRMIAAAGGTEEAVRGEIKVWDVSTAREIHSFQGRVGPIQALAFAPDGRTLLSATSLPQGSELMLWDLSTGEARAGFADGHGAACSINTLAVAPDGRSVALGSVDGSVFQGNWEKAELQGPFVGQHVGAVVCLAYAPDGKSVASAGEDGHVVHRDTATLQSQRMFTVSADRVRSVAYAPDGKTLAVGCSSGRITLWDPARRVTRTVLNAHNQEVRSLQFTADGRTLISAAQDGSIQWRDMGRGMREVPLAGHLSAAWAAAFSPDGATLATAGNDTLIRLWDVRTGQQQHGMFGHFALVSTVAFAPDGRTLVSGGFDRKVRVWDVATGKQRPPWEGHAQDIRCVVFSPDGKWVASGSGTHKIGKPGEAILWEAATGRKRVSLPVEVAEVGALAFSPDGKTLAGMDGSAADLWDVTTGRLLRRFWKGSYVSAVAFTPDGKSLAVADEAGGIRQWDVSTGQARDISTGHKDGIRSLAFSPDGRTLATAGDDRTLRFFQAATGEELAVLHAHTAKVNAVTFSRDGRAMASACADGSVKLWLADGDE